MGDEQPANPAVTSVPENRTVSALLYQPFAFGARLGSALAAGGVESYLKGRFAAPTLPALSVHEPTAVATELSGPPYAAAD